MLAVMWQTHRDDETALRAVRATRARLETAALQAPVASWHLHQSRRSGRDGHRPTARRPSAGRTCQSGWSYAQSHGQRNYITEATSKMQPARPLVAKTHSHSYVDTNFSTISSKRIICTPTSGRVQAFVWCNVRMWCVIDFITSI